MLVHILHAMYCLLFLKVFQFFRCWKFHLTLLMLKFIGLICQCFRKILCKEGGVLGCWTERLANACQRGSQKLGFTVTETVLGGKRIGVVSDEHLSLYNSPVVWCWWTILGSIAGFMKVCKGFSFLDLESHEIVGDHDLLISVELYNVHNRSLWKLNALTVMEAFFQSISSWLHESR